MAFAERDYLRDRTVRFPSNPWWKKLFTLRFVSVATAILALGTTAIYFARDAGSLFPARRTAEGSLQVNVNTATLAELASVPGIGDARAQLIVVNRPYAHIDELVKIPGIGPRTLESMKPFLKVEGETSKLRQPRHPEG